jgi:hypothetical protein
MLIDTKIDIRALLNNNQELDIDTASNPSIKYDLIISDNIITLENNYAYNKTGILVYIVDTPEQMFNEQHINIRYYLRKNTLDMDIKKMFIDLKKELNEKIETITLKDGFLTYNIKMHSIIYIESYRNNVIIHTDKMTYNIRCPLYIIEKKLNMNFIRCHKSYILNILEIQTIKKEEVCLKSRVILPMGKKYKDIVLQAYQNSIDLKLAK